MRFFKKADLGAVQTFETDDLADQLETRRRKRRYAYPAWLCLGSHYLYFGRPVVQGLFWLTGGGLLLWWLVDFFRLPAMVDRHNRRTVDALFRDWRASFRSGLETAPLRSTPPPPQPTWTTQPPPRPAEPAWADRPASPPQDVEPQRPLMVRAPRIGWARHPVRMGSGAVLIAIPILIVALSVLAPRPVYPRGALEPSYRTAREVNVRAAPSTGSPILARLDENLLVRGIVEEVATEGPSHWLRITRGAHEGRYVALQNLDRR
jgi:hypothetical protein